MNDSVWPGDAHACRTRAHEIVGMLASQSTHSRYADTLTLLIHKFVTRFHYSELAFYKFVILLFIA